MNQLSLRGVLNLQRPEMVSFYGAGGKTSLINRLAEEISASGKNVLITTTTKIFMPPGIPLIIEDNTDRILDMLDRHYSHSRVAVLAAEILPSGKLKGIAPRIAEEIHKKLNITVLVEADGARRLPLKGYQSCEPVIPEKSDLIVPVIGADALGKNLDSHTVHRANELAKSIGVVKGALITEEIMGQIFKYLTVIGRRQAGGAKVVPVINKGDLLTAPGKTAWQVADKMDPEEGSETILVTAALNEHPVKVVLNLRDGRPEIKITCALLAAGASSRMGRDKLLLPFGKKTILEHTIEQIDRSGIGDVIIVARPDQLLLDLLTSTRHRFVINEDYRSGIASSLKTGIEAVDSSMQGILFALADQPLIPPSVYRQIIEGYSKNFKPVTCPVYKGRRGNPVLFDRSTWPSLMKLQGDVGGREIINTLSPDKMDCQIVDTESVLQDIDTSEDYRNLFNLTE
ncbi:MAG: selenium cofactor biosynthesis protein YqeC [Bacillota bacterium]|nr:selenium cofactor biosynthesis protein YqeC [Bacillota bacterium]